MGSYTGPRPSGTDYGPAITAAEAALASGDAAPLITLLSHAVEQHIAERLAQARTAPGHPEPRSAAEVQAARERVSAGFAFIGYVEGLHAALEGGVHQAAATTHHDRVRCAAQASGRNRADGVGERAE